VVSHNIYDSGISGVWQHGHHEISNLDGINVVEEIALQELNLISVLTFISVA
jgi:hypothetical protein